MESYMQINANETRDAIAAVEKLDDWFKDKLEAQEALTPIDTPAFTADGVRARMKPITVSCNSYIRLHVRSHGERCNFHSFPLAGAADALKPQAQADTQAGLSQECYK
jgi:hypothetical protein